MFTMLLKFPTRTTKSQFRWKKERPRENKIHSSLIRWWLHSLYLRTYLKTGWSEKGKWKCWRRTLKMCRKKFVLQKRNLRVFSCCITQLNRICDDKICRKVIRIAGNTLCIIYISNERIDSKRQMVVASRMQLDHYGLPFSFCWKQQRQKDESKRNIYSAWQQLMLLHKFTTR